MYTIDLIIDCKDLLQGNKALNAVFNDSPTTNSLRAESS